MTTIISFMTANYVARQVDYNMTRGWGQGDKATAEYFKPVETFATRLEEYLKDIQAMGGGRWDTSSLIRRLARD